MAADRDFHHDTDLDILVKGDAFFTELVLGLLQNFFGPQQLFDTGYHGEHNGGFAIVAGP